MYEPIQEGIIRTVSDLISVIKGSDGRKVAYQKFKDGYQTGQKNANYDSTDPRQSGYSYSSVAKATSNLIAVFPILASRNISRETAEMVSRYIESKACILLSMAMQSANIDFNVRDGADFLKKFHRNLNIGGNGIDVAWNLVQIMADDTIHQMSESSIIESVIENTDYNSDKSLIIPSRNVMQLMQQLEQMRMIQVYDTELNPVSLNDFIVKEMDGDISVSIRPFNEAKFDPKKRIDSVSLLKDQDIKKMNNAVPSLLYVEFYNPYNGNALSTKYIIGVKGTVVGVNTDEILRRIVNDNNDGKSLLKFLRVITGELSATDVILGLSQINDDIKAVKKKGSQADTWKLLQNRAQAAKYAVSRGRQNDYSAITTVVITRDDAEALYKEENLDIQDPKVAKHFMESYNLLGFGIVDDSTESAKFIFDDDNNTFSEYSYTTLQRENDEQYKKMVSLMTRMR